MSQARTEILRKLRSAQQSRINFYEKTTEQPTPAADIPAPAELLALFCQRARQATAEIIFVKELENLGAAIHSQLGAVEQSQRLHCSSKKLQQILAQAGFTVDFGPCTEHYFASVTLASAGIAETGSIVSLSSENLSTAGLFLPPHSLVVLYAKDIVDRLEDVWQKLDCHSPAHGINLITGPSRTGDIEQTIHIGAHGPCRLSIFLVN